MNTSGFEAVSSAYVGPTKEATLAEAKAGIAENRRAENFIVD